MTSVEETDLLKMRALHLDKELGRAAQREAQRRAALLYLHVCAALRIALHRSELSERLFGNGREF